jgi:hypothetical protein
MATLTEAARNGEAIAFTLHPEFNYDQVTFASGTNVVACQVVKGADTAIVAAVATDTANLWLSPNAVNATGGAKRDVVLKRGPAVVNGNLITYPSGATNAQKTAINAALAAANILVRT